MISDFEEDEGEEDYLEDDFDDYDFEDFDESDDDNDPKENIDINAVDDTEVTDLEEKKKGEIFSGSNLTGEESKLDDSLKLGDEDGTSKTNQDVTDSPALLAIDEDHKTEEGVVVRYDSPSLKDQSLSKASPSKNSIEGESKKETVDVAVRSDSPSKKDYSPFKASSSPPSHNNKSSSRRGPESTYGRAGQKKNKVNKKSQVKKASSQASASREANEEEDNVLTLIDGENTCVSSISQSKESSPSKAIHGPGSEAWKSQIESFSNVMQTCMENESKRTKGSRFIQSHVAHDAKHHRSIIERQLKCALQQVHSYRKENAMLTKMIDTSTIHAEFNALRSKNEEQKSIIKQLTEEKRALLHVQRNQEKSLIETERDKSMLPEQEYINQQKMSMFQKKVKSLRDNLYHYQVKAREEAKRNKYLSDQNTKLKVKLKALSISQSVAEQLKGQKMSLDGDNDSSHLPINSCSDNYHNLGEESTMHESTKYEGSVLTKGKEESFEDVRRQRNKLKAIVDSQRASFRQQLVVLQTKLEKSLSKRKELEDELQRREREMKNQILTVKELNKTCEELTKSNMELLEASSLYKKKTSRRGQIPTPHPPPQSIVHKPSPVMARPKEPVMVNDHTFLTGQDFEADD